MSMQFDRFRLAASTADLTEEPAAREHADIVEYRLDLAADPLAALDAYDGELPLLVTNRATWEGGEADESSEHERLETLARAIEHDAVTAVDVELQALTGAADAVTETSHATALREQARDLEVTVVASVHDFETTPPADDLADLLDTAAAEGDVGKLAVTAHDRSDTLALLSATHEATVSGKRVATMAMGEAGSHTRAVAPVYGSKLGYAPVDPAKATAPGQYDLATLSELVAALDTPEA